MDPFVSDDPLPETERLGEKCFYFWAQSECWPYLPILMGRNLHYSRLKEYQIIYTNKFPSKRNKEKHTHKNIFKINIFLQCKFLYPKPGILQFILRNYNL